MKNADRRKQTIRQLLEGTKEPAAGQELSCHYLEGYYGAVAII